VDAFDKSHQVTSQDKLYYDDVQYTRMTSEARDLGDQYGYDGAKRLVTVLRGVGSGFLGNALYDNLTDGRYIDFAEYDYDQTGNRMTRRIDGSDDVIYAYDAANQLTDEGGVTRTFNSNGTFASRSDTSEVWKYSHTDQLAYYDSAASATFTWHFDALGRRIGRERSGGAGAGDTRTYYDGQHEIEVVGWDGSTETQSRKVVFGERIDEVLEHTDVTADPDDVYYAHSDKLGSLQIMVDGTGAIAESYRYREFGDGHVVVDSSFIYTAGAASAFLNGSRYTGCDWMGVVGDVNDPWYHYRARAYRAEVGRFVQTDSEGYVDSSSLYTYVADSPTNAVDPYGSLLLPPQGLSPGTVPLGYGPNMGAGAGLPPGVGPSISTGRHGEWGPGQGSWADPGGGPGVTPIVLTVTCPPPNCTTCDCNIPTLQNLPLSIPLVFAAVSAVLAPGWSCTFTPTFPHGCKTIKCKKTERCPLGRTGQICSWEVLCLGPGGQLPAVIQCGVPCPPGA
jgi:RHS repeat-associated protein